MYLLRQLEINRIYSLIAQRYQQKPDSDKVIFMLKRIKMQHPNHMHSLNNEYAKVKVIQRGIFRRLILPLSSVKFFTCFKKLAKFKCVTIYERYAYDRLPVASRFKFHWSITNNAFALKSRYTVSPLKLPKMGSCMWGDNFSMWFISSAQVFACWRQWWSQKLKKNNFFSI